jgi:hypothetical protein
MAKAVGVKTKQATAIRETEVLDAVSGMTMDSVAKSITAAQIEVQEQLATVSSKLAEQLQVLKRLEEGIALKQAQLKQLYAIEAKAGELDDLHAEIATQRQTWEEEKAAAQRKSTEQASERRVQWAREESEYQYKTGQEHKKQEDAFAYKMHQLERANKDRQGELEKTWGEREAELKKREQELTDLRAQVAGINELVKKEVNGAVAIATNSVKKEYETKMQLASKDAETAQKLAVQEAAGLNKSIAELTSQIASLKSQLEQANRDVKEISTKALESASDRNTSAALQRLMESQPTSFKQQK